MNIIYCRISPQSWKRLSLPNVRVNPSTPHVLCPDILSRAVSIQSFTVFFIILCTSNIFWLNRPTQYTVTLLNWDGSIIIIQEFSKYNSGRYPRYTHLQYVQLLQYISVTRNDNHNIDAAVQNMWHYTSTPQYSFMEFTGATFTLSAD